MPRTIIILLVLLLAMAPATALAGGKAPVGKRVTRSYRAAGKVTLVRVRVQKTHKVKKGQKGTKVRKAKQTRRGKVRSHKRIRYFRVSRTNTLVALGSALTGNASKRMTKKRGLKKVKKVKKVRLTSYLRTRVVLSGGLRDMATSLLPGNDQRKADLALMRTAD